ncbi:MAG TPA: hypothetical protein VLF59_05985 [Candidatus Saccharimonadales bacterium]|nr:hypothetical protein [Candidatus Saccharimonadales bacterium]
MQSVSRGIVCVDLDGTVCNDSHRHHLTPQLDPKHTDWADYHLACSGDTPLMGTILAVQALAHDYDIHIVSGREEIARAVTITWLKQHKISYTALRLRLPQEVDYDDTTPWRYKIRYIQHLQDAGHEVVLFLEDWAMIADKIEEETGVPVLCINSRFPKLYDML